MQSGGSGTNPARAAVQWTLRLRQVEAPQTIACAWQLRWAALLLLTTLPAAHPNSPNTKSAVATSGEKRDELRMACSKPGDGSMSNRAPPTLRLLLTGHFWACCLCAQSFCRPTPQPMFGLLALSAVRHGLPLPAANPTAPSLASPLSHVAVGAHLRQPVLLAVLVCLGCQAVCAIDAAPRRGKGPLQGVAQIACAGTPAVPPLLIHVQHCNLAVGVVLNRRLIKRDCGRRRER